MFRIIQTNLNGVRSAAKKGWLEWVAQQNADVVCVQELKARDADLDDAMRAPGGLIGHFHYAERPGYSGVGLYSRRAPDRVVAGLGIADIDAEGRYLQADFGDLSVVSIYMPSNSRAAADTWSCAPTGTSRTSRST
jgi:exodeoxyribonuclease-3